MTFLRSFISTTVIALSLTSSMLCATYAQTPQGMPAGPGPMGMQPGMPNGERMHPMMDPSKRDAFRAERHQKHLRELKVFLQLQPSQESAWHTFSTVMMTPMKRPTPPAPGELEKMTTPERIDKMMVLKAERDAEMNRRMTATKTFYATLTPAQQKVFDTHTHQFLGHSPMGQHDKIHP